LFFTHETGKRIKMKTNYKVLPAEWNFETGRYKSTAKGSLELNNELDTTSNAILKQYIKLKDEREYLDEEEIRQLLQKQVQGGTSTKRNSVDKARLDFQARKEQVLTDGTLREYRTVFKKSG
jgi:Arm domain-containing DNA-binding protein